MAETIKRYAPGETIFAQGDNCKDVLYIQAGGVRLTVLSKTGTEAVVGTLGPSDFFGEGCLAGQLVRTSHAAAIAPSVILFIGKDRMLRLLHQPHAMSDRFITHVLARNLRIEEDFIDHLFNSTEKRLARTLLLLARYGTRDMPSRAAPRISQEVLAETVGTTRLRVKGVLNKFKRVGFIECDGPIPIKIDSSLLNVVQGD